MIWEGRGVPLAGGSNWDGQVGRKHALRGLRRLAKILDMDLEHEFISDRDPVNNASRRISDRQSETDKRTGRQFRRPQAAQFVDDPPYVGGTGVPIAVNIDIGRRAVPGEGRAN